MSKSVKTLIAILIFFAAIFAAGNGYFYAKTVSLENTMNNKDDSAITKTKTTDTVSASITTTTPVKTTDTTTVATSSTDSRPSSPSDTVVVGQGETLFAIGQKAGVSWTQIADANGIDADKIKVDQTLIIPKNNQIGFTVNKDMAASLQKDVDAGKYLFRLTAVDTAKADSPSAYGITSTDTFAQASIDETAGSATVTAKKGDKIYLITLIQPSTKGAKGIWAIESIKSN
ncbi:TPA: LysM peptidoglycan-binding domain-containing protein [Candidatus Berkelbacteria bacterium]|uniref:Cell wall hydrolase, SleB n=1 Tax=Berkelbacteria bacterium GW2011_GWE1_39_12 TaxID=1618337 RepID=A0A0G4B482_9BACT|nr:MAG: Cell wall hydrolase, SleB [Berkelbacteria bacterium GW2011_GWE1_39_12]HBO60179.1 LysM peptidoglycan-binding domain-containing protein [Candidatus Berkelbacteria bacterium]